MTDTPSTDKSSRSALRWIAIIGALIAALLLTNLAYFRVAAWEPVLTGEPGDVLYAAGFDDFQDEWQRYDGRDSAQMTDGVLRLNVDTLRTIYSAAEPTFRDFDMRVTARATAGDENNAYGVVFRLQEPQRGCDMPLVLFCDMAQIPLFEVPLRLIFRPQSSAASGYYMFLISSDGYYSLWRGTDDGSEKISAWIASDAIETGIDTDNRIRVVAEGDTFRFFINGTPVELCIPDDPAATSTYSAGRCFDGDMQSAWRDDTFQQGKIGMVVDTVQTRMGGITVEFDDLTITSPAPPQGAQA